MKVVFRVDSSLKIGAGHLMRCFALAEEFKNRGFQTCFISENNLPNLQELLASNGHSVIDISHSNQKKLNTEEDANRTIDYLIDLSAEILILDHYELGNEWQESVKSRLSRLVVIDDIPGRKLVCDILLDQNLGREKDHYLPFLQDKTKLLMGSRFVLARKQFKENRGKALIKRKEFNGLNTILLSLGGSETIKNYIKIIETISEIKTNNSLELRIALGFNGKEIKRNTFDNIQNLKIKFLEDPLKLHESIIDSDLCIGYAGSSSWERCILGLPSLVKAISDNQLFIAKNLERYGAADIWHEHGDLKKLIKMLNNKVKWLERSKAASKICDGEGVRRVADAILE
ncbi:MAG: UDP-2,4-diacetamido-2,4,6-trideoxy-beta-L-altropyranose hydrolase [Gammaproteobacteria bacterium]|nr:UDP-2,4-diacetamido-2,4,6-trideoxy-beta-L-altropyranose hydrolase [Gammaproteobacteria bacterium]